jgi:hypothetical protein
LYQWVEMSSFMGKMDSTLHQDEMSQVGVSIIREKNFKDEMSGGLGWTDYKVSTFHNVTISINWIKSTVDVQLGSKFH